MGRKKFEEGIGLRSMQKWCRALVLFCIGGVLYVLIEEVARGRSHWSMLLLGGMCFLLIGLINEKFCRNLGLFWQMLLGGGIITVLELATGLFVNVWMGWNVWDYSNMPLNLWGQICLSYSLLWTVISLAAVFLDDWLRWKLFDEPHRKYKLF